MAEKRFTIDNPHVRKGIELHLDVLLDAMEAGEIESTEKQIEFIKWLSAKLGGLHNKPVTMDDALAYTDLTEFMQAELGKFYAGLGK